MFGRGNRVARLEGLRVCLPISKIFVSQIHNGDSHHIFTRAALVHQRMTASADGGSERSSARRRLKKKKNISALESETESAEHQSPIDPMSLKPLRHILPLPLPILILPFSLLLVCAVLVLLPPSIVMSTSRAVQSLMSRISMSHLARVHADSNTT